MIWPITVDSTVRLAVGAGSTQGRSPSDIGVVGVVGVECDGRVSSGSTTDVDTSIGDKVPGRRVEG
jgi:hypothetical protein